MLCSFCDTETQVLIPIVYSDDERRLYYIEPQVVPLPTPGETMRMPQGICPKCLAKIAVADNCVERLGEQPPIPEFRHDGPCKEQGPHTRTASCTSPRRSGF